MRIGMQSLGRTSEQYPLVTHLFPYFPANSAYQAINNGCNRFMGGVLIEIEHLQVSPKEAWTSLIEIVRFFHFVTPDDRLRIEISFSAADGMSTPHSSVWNERRYRPRQISRAKARQVPRWEWSLIQTTRPHTPHSPTVARLQAAAVQCLKRQPTHSGALTVWVCLRFATQSHVS